MSMSMSQGNVATRYVVTSHHYNRKYRRSEVKLGNDRWFPSVKLSAETKIGRKVPCFLLVPVGVYTFSFIIASG